MVIHCKWLFTVVVVPPSESTQDPRELALGDFAWAEGVWILISKDLSNLNHSVKSRDRDLLGNHHEKFSYWRNMVKLCENTHTMRAISWDFKALGKEQVPRRLTISLKPRGQHLSAGSMEQARRQVENCFQFLPCCPRLRCASHSVWPLSYHLTVTQKAMWTQKS